MDISKALAELRLELMRVEAAIASLEKLHFGRRRGEPSRPGRRAAQPQSVPAPKARAKRPIKEGEK